MTRKVTRWVTMVVLTPLILCVAFSLLVASAIRKLKDEYENDPWDDWDPIIRNWEDSPHG